MAVWESPDGSRRNIPDGVEFRIQPGERIVAQRPEDLGGIRLGDLVAAVTSSVGIKPCSKCNKRRQQLNKYRIPGLSEVTQKVKDLFTTE